MKSFRAVLTFAIRPLISHKYDNALFTQNLHYIYSSLNLIPFFLLEIHSKTQEYSRRVHRQCLFPV